jgi:hypothetical protein
MNYLNGSVGEVDSSTEVCAVNVTIQRSRVELSHDKYLIYATVETVAHGDVDESVTTSNRNLDATKGKKQDLH